MKKILAVSFFALRLAAQGPAVPPSPSTAPAVIPSPGLRTSQASDFQGSVPTGQATATPISLTLQDAIDRGLKTNLGLLVRETGNKTAQAERVRTLASLLPNVQGAISGTEQQLDLASFGFHFSGIPSVIGPFGYNDARASMSQTGFDLTALRNKRAADQNLKAAQLSVQD